MPGGRREVPPTHLRRSCARPRSVSSGNCVFLAGNSCREIGLREQRLTGARHPASREPAAVSSGAKSISSPKCLATEERGRAARYPWASLSEAASCRKTPAPKSAADLLMVLLTACTAPSSPHLPGRADDRAISTMSSPEAVGSSCSRQRQARSPSTLVFPAKLTRPSRGP